MADQTIIGLDHVQLAIPPASEDEARAFYVALLGMSELPKPAALVSRGGLWLRSGPVELHLGVEKEFRPARKAHPAFRIADIDALGEKLATAGYAPRWDDNIADRRRFFADDPFGNRLEFIASGKEN
jgi:catechol 2,3-dioxygenase-like lactoylglutathione lyase family enzyme